MADFMITKFLTPTDIAKLVLPTEILEHIQTPIGIHHVDLQVMDSTNQEWTFRYYTRPTGRYPRPIFTTGWLKFVRAKGLQAEDKLIFSGHHVGAVGGELNMHYKIRVMRPTEFYFQGERIYEHVENFPEV